MTAQNIKDFNIATGVGAPSTAVASLVKAWESKTTQRALRGSSLGLMALSLAACGGSDDATDTTVTPPPVVVPGIAFDYTPDAGEALVGGAGDDTFTGFVLDSVDGTIQTGDTADGGDGVDTVNIIVDGDQTRDGLPLAVTFTNMEIFNIDQTDAVLGSALNSDDFGAAVEQIWQIGQAVDIEVGADVAVGFRGEIDVDTIVTAKTGVSEVVIALDQVDDADDIYLEVFGDDVTTVTVAGSLDLTAGAILDVDSADSLDQEITTLVVAIAADEDVTLYMDYLADLVTFDGSLSSADLVVDVDGGTEYGADIVGLESISTGSGDDTVYVYQDDLSVSLGSGADLLVVTGDLSGGSIALGTDTDADVVAFTNGVSNILLDTGDVDVSSIITISGFGSADFLYLDGHGLASLDADQELALETAINANDATLDSVLAVAAVISDAESDAVTFDFEGTTYIFLDENSDGNVNATDGLISFGGLVSITDGDVLATDPTL